VNSSAAAPGAGQPATYIHATALAIGEAGILIRGPSGSGKSRLALELLAEARRRCLFAGLVGDDRVAVIAQGGRLVAHGHPAIAGHIESRGEGIIDVGYERAAVIRLIVDLEGAGSHVPARLPQLDAERASIAGIDLPRLALDGPEPHHAGIVLDFLWRTGNG
jgi:serine kinase of HPr protein (carbohydrate metabolism regulator)